MTEKEQDRSGETRESSIRRVGKLFFCTTCALTGTKIRGTMPSSSSTAHALEDKPNKLERTMPFILKTDLTDSVTSHAAEVDQLQKGSTACGKLLTSPAQR